jgi:sulfur carrier protein
MIRVNGEARDALPASLLDLLSVEGVAERRRGVAVAVNGAVVPRGRWAEVRLSIGDDVEIVKVLQGG